MTHQCDDSPCDDSPSMSTDECCVKFSARWLLRKLVLHLKQHLSFKCIQRKYGTLLYRTGGDLLTMLSWALGANSTQTDIHPVPVPTNETTKSDRILNEASFILNDILHDEIKRLKDTENDPLNLNIDQYTNDMDPRLCTFIEISGKIQHTRTSNMNSHYLRTADGSKNLEESTPLIGTPRKYNTG